MTPSAWIALGVFLAAASVLYWLLGWDRKREARHRDKAPGSGRVANPPSAPLSGRAGDVLSWSDTRDSGTSREESVERRASEELVAHDGVVFSDSRVHQSARSIMESKVRVFVSPLRFQPVEIATVPTADVKFYDAFREELTRMDFKWLGDYLALYMRDAFPEQPAPVVRVVIGFRGSISGSCWEFGSIKAVEFSTEFSDRTWSITNNMVRHAAADRGSRFRILSLQSEATVLELLAKHRKAVEDYLFGHPGVDIVRADDHDAHWAAAAREHRASCEYQRSVDFMSEEAIRKICEDKASPFREALVDEIEMLQRTGWVTDCVARIQAEIDARPR